MVSFKGKKAQELFMAKVVLELIIAAIAITLLCLLACKLFQVDDTERAALKNFDMLELHINDVLDNQEKFATTSITYYLPDNYILVGFDKLWDENPNKIHSLRDHEGPLLKPNECREDREETACLCLYKTNIEELGDKGDPESNLVTCKNFEGNIIFIGSFYYEPAQQTEGTENNPTYGGSPRTDVDLPTTAMGPYKYEYLQLYSITGNWLPVIDLYIEKYNKSNTLYVFLTRYTQSSISRYKYLSVPCPKGSAEACWTETQVKDFGETPLDKGAECSNTYSADREFSKICEDTTGNGLCEVICLQECEDGPIENLCKCGAKLVDYGDCNQGQHAFTFCESPTSCNIYQDTDIDPNTIPQPGIPEMQI